MRPENFLTISDAFKHIPYTQADRPDGGHCYAFAALKGASAERIGAVAEVADCEALRSAIVRINERSTPFFTIGCEKDSAAEDGGWRAGGYIEFAFNYSDIVLDAANYFPLFFHFDRAMKERDLPVAIQFQWDLTPSKFLDASGVVGYTAVVWVRSGLAPTRELVVDTWTAAVDALARFLAIYPTHGEHRIYPRGTKARSDR